MFSDTVQNAISTQKKRSERYSVLKEKILLVCKERIINYSNLNQTQCIYKIPVFILGYPPYNVDSMNKHLFKNLNREGFHVVKLNPEYIYISWNIKDLAKNEVEKKEISTNLNAFVNNSKSR